MRKRKRKIQYGRIFLCLIILIAIILGITKLFKIDETENLGSDEETVLSEITLTGNNTIYLYKNEEYKEPGYKATDSNGNDTTNQVRVENNIEIEKSGEYEIKYTINENVEKTRKVIVKEAKLLKQGKKSNNNLPVLMYHYFFDGSDGTTAENSNWLEISKFEEQLKYLKENNFYYPTWDEVADFVDGKIDLPENSVILSMDDGHKSVYNLAIPLLDKYEIPATAFIITKNFDTKNVEKYKKSTVDFQSHTDNMHRAGGSIGHGGIFTALSVEEGVEDLKTSIQKLGGNCGALAYPYGDNTEKTWEAAEKAGFKVAFTTEYASVKPGMNKYALPRVRIYSDITIGGFKSSVD